MRAHLKLLALSFLALTPIVTASSGVWWAILGMQSLGPNDIQIKETLNIVGSGLSDKQMKMIQNHNSPALVSTIARGAKMAINECQRQFRHRRWNCSSNDPYNVFGSILKTACRETAFAYGITAAAVSHQISRACSEGQLETCRCDNRYAEGTVTEAGWQYGGCSDNIRFADKFAKKFLNLGERYQDFRARVNIHNNEAGKTAVRSNMNLQCKCHGPSRSCTLNVCWRKVPNFRKVGQILKEKFDGASKVEIEQSNSGKRIKFTPVNKLHKPPSRSDLIYYEESPNFCIKNSRLGSVGTKGRECNGTSMGTDGCDLLCCGRGYKSKLETKNTHCNCNFVWCCRVACDSCKTMTKVLTCL